MKKVFVLLLAAALVVCTFAGCTKPQEEFTAPKDYTTVVQVTINPTVNLYLDADDIVLAVEYVNADAKESYKKIESELIGAPLAQSVDLVVKTAVDDGYLTENKEVKVEVVEAKQQEKQEEILSVAFSAAQKTLEENKIEAEVVVFVQGKEVEKEELSTPTENYTPTPELITTPEATEQPTQEPTKMPTPTPAPTAKSAQLTKNAPYCVYKFNEMNMLERYKITFTDGEYAFSVKPFDLEDYSDGQGEVIVYEGKTYYEAGGRGGGGEYTVNGSKVTLVEDDITLTIVSDKTLKVENTGSIEEFLKIGDLIKIS